MAQFPLLPLWTDAWVADLHHLTLEEEGIYIRLLVLMWRTPGCRVPNDDGWLAKHMHLTSDEIATKVRPVVVEFCETDGNWLRQKRLQREFVRAFKNGQRLGALHKRWKNQQNASNVERNSSNELLSKLNQTTIKSSSNGESQRVEPEEAGEKKRPDQMTLAEINQLRYGKPNP